MLSIQDPRAWKTNYTTAASPLHVAQMRLESARGGPILLTATGRRPSRRPVLSRVLFVCYRCRASTGRLR